MREVVCYASRDDFYLLGRHQPPFYSFLLSMAALLHFHLLSTPTKPIKWATRAVGKKWSVRGPVGRINESGETFTAFSFLGPSVWLSSRRLFRHLFLNNDDIRSLSYAVAPPSHHSTPPLHQSCCSLLHHLFFLFSEELHSSQQPPQPPQQHLLLHLSLRRLVHHHRIWHCQSRPHQRKRLSHLHRIRLYRRWSRLITS